VRVFEPSAFDAVSEMVYVPALLYVWEGFFTVLVAPSPFTNKLHGRERQKGAATNNQDAREAGRKTSDHRLDPYEEGRALQSGVSEPTVKNSCDERARATMLRRMTSLGTIQGLS